MKIFLLIALILLISFQSYCQDESKKEITEAAATALGNIKTKGIKFGLSLGFNRTFRELYEVRISPVDTTLRYERASPASFMLSSTLSFPILKGKFGGSYYRKIDPATGNAVGNPYFVPYGLAIIATVNLVTFNAALGGNGVFNQKLDGGIGLGYTFGDNVQLGLTFEMLSFRQPRNFLKNYENDKVIVNKTTLMNISYDDNNYFTEKYVSSVSLKIIYILN